MSFTVQKRGALEYLTADSLPVKHAFTTRFGGVSEGSLSSLNLGLNRGDSRENVEKIYEILCSALKIDPAGLVLAKQTHSDLVAQITARNCGEGLTRQIPAVRDAMMTDDPAVTLVVFTADCAPVLLYDPVRRAVGAVHSGWRGTAQGIAAKTVQAMQAAYGTDPADLIAAIGPSIGACCFETDADVPEAMRAALGSAAEAAIEPRGKKYYVNNKLLIRIWLERAGLRPENISASCDCTACQPERFWSYRKVGSARGAQAALISLSKWEDSL